MRNSHIALIAAVLCSLSAAGAAQAYPPRAAAPAAAPAPAAPVILSTLLRPSLNTVQQTIDALRLEKWKRGSVREEANSNIGAILRDLQTDLPPLLREADAAPGTLSKELPVARNVAALYDVLLRVYEASRVAAPGEQVDQLQHALVSLGNARVALDQSLQGLAVVLEKQVSTMRGVLQAQAVVQCPVAPPPLATVCLKQLPRRRVVRRRRVRAKAPLKKPSTTAAATQNKATPQNKGK